MRKQIHSIVSKKSIPWLFIFPLLFIMYGCPYSSSYKIDPEPTILADDAFVGKWTTLTGDDQPLRMIVSKKNDYEYDLSFTGHIDELRKFNVVKKDTVKATAFFSDAVSRRFLNINVQGLYYIAEFIYKDDKITILPLCEHFTSKIIKNDSELKQALESHFKTRLYPLYDDDFCIRGMWRVNEAHE